jgi:integrin beta 3
MAIAQQLEDLAYSLGRRFADERERARESVAATVAALEIWKAKADGEIRDRLSALKDGLPGEPGRDGSDGADGKDGQEGPPGKDGRDGIDGKDGRDGIDGKDGMPVEPDIDALAKAIFDRLREQCLELDEALFSARKRFDSLAAAMQERIATLKDGEPGPPGEPGPQGIPGSDGVTGEARGLYDPKANYSRLDHVSFNGSEWIARRDDPGALPGDGWMLGAQGKRGKAGVGIETASTRGYVLILELTGGKTVSVDLAAMFERYHEESRQ